MRIFLDANVLFSAAKSDGAVHHLLTLLEKSGHECCVDGYVIEEARRNQVAKAPDRVVALERLLPRMKTAGAQRGDTTLEASLRYRPRIGRYWQRPSAKAAPRWSLAIARISGLCTAARFMA